MRVFEWGSGGSTLFFARRAQEVIAVEHDQDWTASVQEACRSRGHQHVTVQFIPPDDRPPAVTFDPGDAAQYYSSARLYSGLSFQRYAEHILNFPDAHFDAVVVDGRARPACLRLALPKVKPGGLLVLDNSDRAHYRAARDLAVAAHWKEEEYFGPGPYLSFFWQTVVWQRPA
jgi:predicted O-methyltransferase YrrM